MGFLHWPVYLVGLGGEEGNSALLTYCTHLPCPSTASLLASLPSQVFHWAQTMFRPWHTV